MRSLHHRRKHFRSTGEPNYFGTGADGNTTISSDTNLGTTEDGDILVKNYLDLTINSSQTLSVDNRCRGLLLFVDGDLVVNGTISMSSKGCKANPATSGTDADTPVAPGDGNGVGATGIRFPFRTAGGGDTLAAAVFDGTGTALYALIGSFPELSANGTIIDIKRTGADGGPYGVSAYTDGDPGDNGATGESGGGGAGSSDSSGALGGKGGNGTCFSGGSSGGGGGKLMVDPSNYGGIGGSAVNGLHGAGVGIPNGATGYTTAAGVGAGGLLIIICSGNITGSGSIESKGAKGPDGGYSTGGGTGGGNIIIARVGTDAAVSKDASGGVGGDGANDGGAGGDGSIQTLQISA